MNMNFTFSESYPSAANPIVIWSATATANDNTNTIENSRVTFTEAIEKISDYTDIKSVIGEKYSEFQAKVFETIKTMTN